MGRVPTEVVGSRATWTPMLLLFASFTRRCAADESELPFSKGFHNLFVLALLAFLSVWVAKVMYQIFKAMDLNSRLSNTHSLQLEGMSIYAQDFQLLIRQHFNQILRIRRTVPAMPVSRLALSVHLHPESLRAWHGAQSGTDAATNGFGVQLMVDALVPCSIQLFWGVQVSACNDLAQRLCEDSKHTDQRGRQGAGSSSSADAGRSRWRLPRPGPEESTRSLLEMEEMRGVAVSGHESEQSVFSSSQCAAKSREFFLSAGLAQQYTTPSGDLIVPSQLPFDLSQAWSEDGLEDQSMVTPLAIVVTGQRRPVDELGAVQHAPVLEAHGEISFVKFRRADDGRLRPELMQQKQLIFGEKSMHEIQGVFGFEEDGESDCIVCLSRKKNTLFFPCRHCAMCSSCVRGLRDEKCPLCRSSFSSFLTFPQAPSRTTTAEDSPPRSRASPQNKPPDSAPSAVPSASGSETPVTVDSGSAAVTPERSRVAEASSQRSSAGGSPADGRPGTSREAPATRPRGVSSALSASAQGSIRRAASGRARFSDRSDVVQASQEPASQDVPLLQEGGAGSAAPSRSEAPEENRGLIRDRPGQQARDIF